MATHNGVTKDTMLQVLKYQRDELSAKDAEITQLQSWVNDLQSGMYVNCVYCGHRYGLESDAPSSVADVLKEHVEQCPKHPMSTLKTDRDRWKTRVETLECALETEATCMSCIHYSKNENEEPCVNCFGDHNNWRFDEARFTINKEVSECSH